MFKFRILAGVSALVICGFISNPALSEDCVDESPIGNPAGACTLDENTTGAITIQDFTLSGGQLNIGADVLINHTIDSSQLNAFGAITTTDGNFTIDQNADIGRTQSIESLTIGDTDTWNARGDIITNSSGGNDIDLGGASGGTVMNMYGGITVIGDLNGNTLDTVNILTGASSETVTFTGEMANVGLDVQSGTLNATTRLGSVNGLQSITVRDGASLILADGAQTTGQLDLDGTIRVSSTNSLQANTYTGNDGDGADIYLGLSQGGGNLLSGRINVSSGGPVDFSGDTVYIEVESGGQVIGEGTHTYNNIITGNGGATLLPTLQDTSFLYDFTFVPNGNNVNLQITRAELGDITTSAENFTSADTLLNTLSETADSTLQGIQFNVANASSSQEFNTLLESTQPSLDASAFTIAGYISDQSRTLVQKRIHSLRNRKKIQKAAKITEDRSYNDELNPLTSLEPAAGNPADTSGYVVPNNTKRLALKRLQYLRRAKKIDDQALSEQYRFAQRKKKTEALSYKYDDRDFEIWSQTFTGNGKQHDRDHVKGYKYETSGITIGADANSWDKDFIVGGFLTYADSDVEAENTNQSETHIENYQLGLYSTYLLDNDRFVNGFATISLNDIAHDRFRVGGTDFTARSEYDGIYLQLGSEYGFYHDVGDNWVVTPSVGLYYSRMQFEDYRERGASGANLIVQTDSMYRVDLGPSLTASSHYMFENGISFIPEANISYTYNVTQNKMTARAYLEGTANDTTGPVEAKFTGFNSQDHFFNMSLGSHIASDRWKLLTQYNYQVKEDFTGHLASLQLNYSL